MEYPSQENVHYMTDLYAVSDVPRDAGLDDIERAIIARLWEYHPSFFVGRAQEFQTAAHQMTVLLNRARVILLDDSRRTEYTDILEAWEAEGYPVASSHIVPVNVIGLRRIEAARMTPAELEAAFASEAAEEASRCGYNPRMTARLEQMYAEAQDDDDLRADLEAMLLAEDRVLTMQEINRGVLIGTQPPLNRATLPGYAAGVHLSIEAARTDNALEQKRRALGAMSTRLALMAGDTPNQALLDQAAALVPVDALAAHFDVQAEQIRRIAERREAIVKRRLELLRPTYYVPELQTEAQPNFVIHVQPITGDGPGPWLSFSFDPAVGELTSFITTDTIQAMLDAEDYAGVYEAGYNVLGFTALEQIDPEALLTEAWTKHLVKFYPELFATSES